MRPFLWITGVFLLSRVLLLMVGYISHEQMLDRMSEDAFPWSHVDSPVLDMWGPWDAGWYIGIAQWGYMNEPPFDENGELVTRNYAFFPAFPMMVRWIFKPFFGNNLYVPGLVLANALAILAFWMIYLICQRLLENTEVARGTVLLGCFFPNSFIYSSFYTESLFLFLIAGVLLASLNRRWIIAGLFGAVLSATRINGLTAAIPVFFLILQAYPELLKGRISRESLVALASLAIYPLGLLAFMLHLNYVVGDPLAFMTVAGAWGREMGFYLHELVIGPFHGGIHTRYLALYSLLGLSVIHVLLLKKQYLLYITSMVLVLPALVNGHPHNPFYSMPRFLLVVFPLYISIAMILRGKPTAFAITLASLALINGFLMVYWATGMPLVI